MAKEALRKPDWWSWPADWMAEIKHRTGWQDIELAERLGCSRTTIYNLRKAPYQVRGGIILRLLELHRTIVTENRWKDE